MSAPANAGTVALIAHGIMERKVQTGELEAGDFSPLKCYGTNRTYLERTIHAACLEAWKIVSIAEETRPAEPDRI